MRSKLSAQARKAIDAVRTATRRARSHAAEVLEVAGIAGIAVSVGGLAGAWWGALTGSVLAVLYANALGARAPQGDD